MKLLLFGFVCGHFDDFSVDTNPAPLLAIPIGLFPGTVTLAASALALRRRKKHDVTVNAAPAIIRRRLTA